MLYAEGWIVSILKRNSTSAFFYDKDHPGKQFTSSIRSVQKSLPPVYSITGKKDFQTNMKIMTTISPLRKYILAWSALPFIAIINGILRELTYSHMAGEQLAHQISSVILSLFIAFYVIALNSRFTLKNNTEAVTVGLTWLAFTIVFETLMGIALGTPISQQLESYNIIKGNLWVLVLLSVLLSPVIFRRIKVLQHAG